MKPTTKFLQFRILSLTYSSAAVVSKVEISGRCYDGLRQTSSQEKKKVYVIEYLMQCERM